MLWLGWARTQLPAQSTSCSGQRFSQMNLLQENKAPSGSHWAFWVLCKGKERDQEKGKWRTGKTDTAAFALCHLSKRRYHWEYQYPSTWNTNVCRQQMTSPFSLSSNTGYRMLKLKQHCAISHQLIYLLSLKYCNYHFLCTILLTASDSLLICRRNAY